MSAGPFVILPSTVSVHWKHVPQQLASVIVTDCPAIVAEILFASKTLFVEMYSVIVSPDTAYV